MDHNGMKQDQKGNGSFHFLTSPTRKQKLALLFHAEASCEYTETIQNIKKDR